MMVLSDIDRIIVRLHLLKRCSSTAVVGDLRCMHCECTRIDSQLRSQCS